MVATSKNLVKRWWAAVAFGVMVLINAAANILPINGNSSAQVSDSYPNLFAPAGYTFAIWGVIYLLLGLYSAWQLGYMRNNRSRLSQKTIDEITPLYIMSSVFNVAWIFAWHYRIIWLSLVLIIGMLICLIQINNLLYKEKFSLQERLLVKAPFSIYFGWLTVATIANVCVWLVSSGWDGFGQSDQFWMVSVLIIGAVIGIATMVRNTDCAYGAVIVWAFGGILVKHLSEKGWDGAYPLVIGALIPTVIVLVIATIIIFIRAYETQMRPLLKKQ